MAGAMYVATTGNDTTGDGTSGNPWATMAKAMAQASPGTIVHFAAGTYTSAGGLVQTNNGTASQPITFVSDTLHGAVLSSSDVAQNQAFLQFNGDYVTVDGFSITAPGNYVGLIMRGIYPTTRRLFVYHVADFNVSANGGAGIDFVSIVSTTTPVHAMCDSCVVLHIGGGRLSTYTYANSIQGIYMSSPYGTIQNCVVADGSGFGIHAYHAGSNWLVENNTVHSLKNSGILLGTDSTFVQQGSVARNNCVRSCAQYGIREYQDVMGWVGSMTYEYNNISSSGIADYFIYTPANHYGGVTNTHTNDVTGNPLFVNEQPDGSGDYHLQSGSVCIDAAVATAIPSKDIEGTSRPQGAGYDVGAYEYYILAVNMAVVTWITRDSKLTLTTRSVPRLFGGTLALTVPVQYLSVTWTTRDEKASQNTRDELVTWKTR